MLTRLLALAAGAAMVFAVAPFGFAPVTVASLALLFVLWEGAPSARDGAWLGFAFGLGLFGAGVSWVFIALETFGGMPGPVAVVATAGFVAYLALWPAVAGAVVVRFTAAQSSARLAAAAGAWTLAEWLRGFVFSGFPWLSVGYAELLPGGALPLAGYAPLGGVFLVSLAVAACAAAVAAITTAMAQARPRRVVALQRGGAGKESEQAARHDLRGRMRVQHAARDGDRQRQRAAGREAQAVQARRQRTFAQPQQHGQDGGGEHRMARDAGEVERRRADAPADERDLGRGGEQGGGCGCGQPAARQSPGPFAPAKPGGGGQHHGQQDLRLAQACQQIPARHGQGCGAHRRQESRRPLSRVARARLGGRRRMGARGAGVISSGVRIGVWIGVRRIDASRRRRFR